MSSRATAHDFEDIAAPLEEDKAQSFMNDESVRKSFGSKSKSFITARDVGVGESPRERRRFSRSVSSLGESMFGLSEAVDEDEYLLCNDNLQLAAYECLLLANRNTVIEGTDEAALAAIHSLRKRLDITEDVHTECVATLHRTLERVQGKVPPESTVFRLFLIETLVLQGTTNPRHPSDAAPKAELQHLAVFASATQFAIKKLCSSSGQPEAYYTKLLSQLSYDVKKMKSRLVVFSTSPTPEHCESVRALLTGMVVRYTQPPFVGTPEGGPKVSAKEEKRVLARDVAEGLPPTPEETPFAAHGGLAGAPSTDDLVVTEGESTANAVLPVGTCRSGSVLSVLNVSGDPEDEISIDPASGERHKKSSPLDSLPLGIPNAGAILLGYTYPLNVMVYATLFHTFFVEIDDDIEADDKGVTKAQWRKQHGIHRSRRQESRMKDLVDLLSPFRCMFGVSGFLHASCFIHVVFTENVEGSLDVADMFSLLSIDCYYYPGFKSYCTVQNSTLDADERFCRQQVLRNLKDEFTTKLADYHAELAESPEDLLFIAKLYAIILEFNSNSFEEPKVDQLENGDSITIVHESLTERDESETEHDRILASCVAEIKQSFGEDVAQQVRDVMENGGVEEALGMGCALSTYSELVCLVICSTIKHFIRVKYKVVTSRNDIVLKPYEMWMSHLSSTATKRRGSMALPNHSLSSLAAAVGTATRKGAARLAPSASFCKSNSVFTLNQINNHMRLSMTQVRHLLEVLLLEIHADVKYYSSSLVCVLPSAVSVVLNVYCNLLSEDMSEALDSLRMPSVPGTALPIPLMISANAQGPPKSVTPRTSSPLSDTETRMVSAITLADGTQSTPVSSPKHSESRDIRSPPPPKRSQSPPIPVRSEVQVHNDVNRMSTNMVHLDDMVSLSMFVTNLIYTMLMLQLLQVNIHTYLSYFHIKETKKPQSFERQTPVKTKTWSQLLSRNRKQATSFAPSSTMPSINTAGLTQSDSVANFGAKRGSSMPEPVLTWDQESSSGAGGKMDEVLNPLQDMLLKKWKHVVDTALDVHVQRVVSVDTFEPVGTSQEAGISSSAVDLTLMTNRIAVLVAHGIQNAWDALKASRVALHTNPVPPEKLTEEYLCQHFNTHCESLIDKFEEECKAVLNKAFCKYISLLCAEVEGDWDSTQLDFKRIRAKMGVMFKGADVQKLSLRANDISFCQQRMKDIHTKTISSYHLVTWSLLEQRDNDSSTASIQSPQQQLFKFTSPLSPIRSPRSPLVHNNMFDPLSISRADDSVATLLKFIAVKIAVFGLQPVTSRLYSADDVAMSQLLDTLEHSLTPVIELLVPTHRVTLLSYTLGAVAQLLSYKLVCGKMIRVDSRFDFFQRLIEDLFSLKEFFLNRDEDGNPTFLQEKDVQLQTACLFGTVLLLLARNPTHVLHQQAVVAPSGVPVHITYSKSQLQSMIVQIAGRCPLAHDMLLEAMECQREADLQQAWEAQRNRLMGSNSMPSRLLSPSKAASTAPAKSSSRHTDDKKMVSRTCAVQ